MMNLFSKPATGWAFTILRLALGAYCVRLGVWGYVDAPSFEVAIRSYAGFTGVAGVAYVAIGPYAIFAAGALLILGLLTQFAALFAFLVFFPLVVAAGGVVAVEKPLMFFPEQRTIYKDLTILFALLSLVLGGAGALSFDNVLKGLYRDK